MEENKKYCPNCGKEQGEDSQFCSTCGYDFSNKVFPDKSEQKENKLPVAFEKLPHLLKDKRVIAGITVAVVLIVAYFLYGGVDIAGTYESDYTINNEYQSNTLEITRGGDATLGMKDDEEQLDFSVTLKLIASDDGDRYYPDLSEDVGLKLTMPNSELYDESYMFGFGEMMDMAGLKQQVDGEMVTISGEVSPFIAEQLDLDLNDIEIIRDDNFGGLYLFDELYYSIDENI